MFGRAMAIVFLSTVMSAAAAGTDTPRNRLLKAPEKSKKPLTLVLVDVDRQAQVLADIKAQKATPATELKPNRIYLHKDELDGFWYYVLTNFEGKYRDPVHEYLRSGNVVSGKLLGAKNESQRFLLNRQGLWVPTFKAESLDVWISEGPRPRIRTTDYGTVNGLELSNHSVRAGGRSPGPRLLTVDKNGEPELLKMKGAPLPFRVYGVYNPLQKGWAYAMTNFAGSFEQPLELLYSGTVLPAAYIGAPGDGRFRLNDDFRWVPTMEDEVHVFLLPSRPKVVKRERFLTPPLDPLFPVANIRFR